jgi:hypothetical protein
LSWKAKGIHTYLLSLPETWIVRLNHLKSISTDGYDSTVAGVNELLDKKYLWRRPCCGENPGGWEYYVYQYPQLEDPFRSGDSPTRDIPDSGKPVTNKDRFSKVNKEYKEKPLTPFQGEEESSAMASHSSTQTNLFPTYPNEGHTSGSANAKLKSADGKETAPHSEAPPRTRKSRESKPVDEKFIAELQRLNPDKDVEREIKAAQTWLLSRPDRKYTRGFLVNWVIRSKNIINPDKFHNNNSF